MKLSTKSHDREKTLSSPEVATLCLRSLLPGTVLVMTNVDSFESYTVTNSGCFKAKGCSY